MTAPSTLLLQRRHRLRQAWADDRGAAEVIQVMFLAVRSRATDVGTDIENSNLP